MKNARIHLLSVLKGERDGCSGRMRKQLNGLEAAILRLEDKEEKVKRRAQKVQAYLEWQTEAKATQLSVVAEQWVLAHAIEGNDTGHLLMQERGERLVARVTEATENENVVCTVFPSRWQLALSRSATTSRSALQDHTAPQVHKYTTKSAQAIRKVAKLVKLD